MALVFADEIEKIDLTEFEKHLLQELARASCTPFNAIYRSAGATCSEDGTNKTKIGIANFASWCEEFVRARETEWPTSPETPDPDDSTDEEGKTWRDREPLF